MQAKNIVNKDQKPSSDLSSNQNELQSTPQTAKQPKARQPYNPFTYDIKRDATPMPQQSNNFTNAQPKSLFQPQVPKLRKRINKFKGIYLVKR